MPPFPAPFIIPPISTHTHTLVLLHDRGSSGQDFGLDLLSAMDSTGRMLQTLFPGTKFIFPTANHQCVTAFIGGPKMSQWFDNVSTTDPSEREALQLKGLREGCKFIHDLVDEESIPSENIYLGGFSQGSAMALYALLTYRSGNQEDDLGGFVGMSGWLPLQNSLHSVTDAYAHACHEQLDDFDVNERVSTLLRNQIGLPPLTIPPPIYRDIPLHFSHGEMDHVVPLKLAQQAAEKLRLLDAPITLKTYEDLDHSCKYNKVIDDIAAFLDFRGVK